MKKLLFYSVFQLCVFVNVFSQNPIGQEIGSFITDYGKELKVVQLDEMEGGQYFCFGAGYGVSYGGLGARMLTRFSNTMGSLGMSFGFGHHFPTEKLETGSAIFWTGGLQFYLENFYLDCGFGPNVRAKYQGKEQNFFGMSFLLGYNLFFSTHLGVNMAVGITGPLIYPEDLDVPASVTDVRFCGDIGLLYRF